MNIIKLSAINSTNDYLKELLATRYVENFTVVTAENQTGGRGQMGTAWAVEPGKNLTFSLLVKDLLPNVNTIFSLNAGVAVGISKALVSTGIPGIIIKWPNDILAGNKKVGGILIENSIKSDGEIFSVIGIGVNVNQQNFEGLPKASSLALFTGREIDKEELLVAILEEIKRAVSRLINKDEKGIWDDYHSLLYKKGLPMPFEKAGKTFMGIIESVTPNGSLRVRLEDETVSEYGIKEVQLLY
ncbi:biotin--[acetyl-CoA-carboxylase] ligase [Flavobacterium sp. RHBU_24]|uniref:biotin--[acetyl-CoA-carboxylase] ligase n=1 Tax=Flavobacterium sp. RHBU_24 TaxID=3391185 RepID=UPI003984E87E